MSPEHLHEFIENKFDALVEKNNHLYNPLVQAIQNNLAQLERSFLAEVREEIKEFIRNNCNRQPTEE